jgi:limonene 1,2-monooxygenase
MSDVVLRHGVFMAPFHPVDEDPTECLQRDFGLMEWLDRLGFEEAWIGEHHSAGYEIIASPELFIAAAAERTKKLRFGTGVVSLPYHNPLMVANRIIQLDHQTRGRVMFGAGPGLLTTDAMMLGIDPNTQRDRMAESLDIILRLFKGEAVTQKSDWYTLVNARAHLLPYTKPHPEIAVASAVSPSGGRLAGKYGFNMLCVAASDPTGGFDALAENWKIANEIAAENGRTMDPNRLRLVGPMFIAETRELARERVRFGFEKYLYYFNKISRAPGRYPVPAGRDPVDWFMEAGHGIIGTPDDAIAMIEKLQKKQGAFGVFCQQVHNWADFEGTKKSYELYARYVMPHFRKANANRVASIEWADQNSEEFGAKRMAAVEAMFAKHKAERETKAAAE